MIPHSKWFAIVLNLASMFCWGSWASLYKFTPQVRYEMWFVDFILGNVLVVLVLCFSFGQWQVEESSQGIQSDTFISNLKQVNWTHLLYGFAGGAVLNLANILTTGAVSLAGLAVAFPITFGTGLSLGTLSTYFATAEDKRPSLPLLLVGVGLAVVAVVCVSLAAAYKQAPLTASSSSSSASTSSTLTKPLVSPSSIAATKAVNTQANSDDGGANSSSSSSSSSRKGVAVAALAGVLTAGWGPLSAKAMEDQPGALNAYGGCLVFNLACLATVCPYVAVLMRKPFSGAPFGFAEYKFYGWKWHVLAGAAGCINGLGSQMNFLAGTELGFTISYPINMCSPLIAMLWGVLYWKEFRGAGTTSFTCLAGMVLFYLGAIVAVFMAASS